MLLLAVVQGLTEFLPVSSSGHLVIFQHVLDTREGDVLFNVVLHLGTLGSVLAVYQRDIRRLLRWDPAARAYLFSLGVATLPAIAVGLLAGDAIDAAFGRPDLAAAMLLVTAAILVSTRGRAGEAENVGTDWQPVPPPWRRALFIGGAQALAILPGISRSGATIAAALWAGRGRHEAARFSFLLSVIAIPLALGREIVLKDGYALLGEMLTVGPLLSLLTSFLVGLGAVWFTRRTVTSASFWRFSFWCVLVSVAWWTGIIPR
jgi:undecaprenyl-diphosphatase